MPIVYSYNEDYSLSSGFPRDLRGIHGNHVTGLKTSGKDTEVNLDDADTSGNAT
ncbi:MAG: hypothetical protein LBH04_06170 [Tannerellaceae bacterium]|nr:hypothetical protein [Tannerellaceae bacterium]